MPMMCRSLVLAVVLVLGTMGRVAHAGEPGWYYGLGAGQSAVDLDTLAMDEFANFVLSTAGTPVTGSATFDDGDTSWSLFFGYQFSPWFAVEAGYLDLGSFPYRYSGTIDLGTQGVAPSSFGLDFETSGYPISAIGILPLGPSFDVHARLGLYFTETELKLAATAGSASLATAFEATTQDVFFGAGAALHLGDRWSFTLDWVRFKDVGKEEDTFAADAELLSLAILYRFGLF